MWFAVVERAIDDARGESIAGATSIFTVVRLQNEARAWLTENGPDFVLVCEYAGLDPEIAFDLIDANIANLEPVRTRTKGRKSRSDGSTSLVNPRKDLKDPA